MGTLVEDAIRRLSQEMGSWKSIEIRSHEDFVNSQGHDPAEFPAYHCKYHYIETALGQRLSEARLVVQGSNEVNITIDYCDGNLAARLLRREVDGKGQDQINIKRVFANEGEGRNERPVPLVSLYLELSPLYKSLSKSAHVGSALHMGRQCDRFRFDGIGEGLARTDYVYWLDRSTSVPLKIEYFEDATPVSENGLRAVWSADSLDRVQTHHLSLKSEITTYYRSGPHKGEVRGRYSIAVDEVSFDKDYPKSTFWPVISPDAFVYDEVHRKAVVPKNVVSTSKTAGPPGIAATPDVSGWDSSILIIALGIAVLGAGLAAWWRHR